METKRWFASKTIWAQVIGFAAMLVAGFGVEWFDPELQTATAGGFWALVNIILRAVTKAPIALNPASP